MALFDKFVSGGRGRTSSKADILENLKNILNTRRHYGSILEDFGVRSPTEHRSRHSMALAVMREMRENIEAYEPRITVHAVELDEGTAPFRLGFTIRCSLLDEPDVLHISVDTVFGNAHIAGQTDGSR